MSIPSEPAAEHRSVASTFADRVGGAAPEAWGNPAPVPDWTALDVVRHLLDWFPAFLAGGADVRLAPGPSVDVDPVSAWEHHARAVQELLDDPATPSRRFTHPMLPEMPLSQAISQFYTNDVFMHTWDLARATGQDERLDEDRCRVLYEGMQPMDDVLRQSGQYGPKVAVPDDADWQTKLLGFIGRIPELTGARPWSP